MTRSRTNQGLNLIAALAAFMAGCASQSAGDHAPQEAQLVRAVSPPERLQPPEHLSGTARLVLRNRMASHARDMGDLTSAIMLLQYDRIRDRADAVAADASWARPLTQDATELNSALPERFFELQDQLRIQARALSGAAEQMKALAVADAYGRLSETCVSCHAVYREGAK